MRYCRLCLICCVRLLAPDGLRWLRRVLPRLLGSGPTSTLVLRTRRVETRGVVASDRLRHGRGPSTPRFLWCPTHFGELTRDWGLPRCRTTALVFRSDPAPRGTVHGGGACPEHCSPDSSGPEDPQPQGRGHLRPHIQRPRRVVPSQVKTTNTDPVGPVYRSRRRCQPTGNSRTDTGLSRDGVSQRSVPPRRAPKKDGSVLL